MTHFNTSITSANIGEACVHGGLIGSCPSSMCYAHTLEDFIADGGYTFPTAHRTSPDEEGSFRVWLVFPATMTDEEILTAIWAHDDCPSPEYRYSGPGQMFQNEGNITRKGSRALYKQYHGRDI